MTNEQIGALVVAAFSLLLTLAPFAYWAWESAREKRAEIAREKERCNNVGDYSSRCQGIRDPMCVGKLCRRCCRKLCGDRCGV